MVDKLSGFIKVGGRIDCDSILPPMYLSTWTENSGYGGTGYGFKGEYSYIPRTSIAAFLMSVYLEAVWMLSLRPKLVFFEPDRADFSRNSSLFLKKSACQNQKIQRLGSKPQNLNSLLGS